MIDKQKYLTLLEEWVKAAEGHLYRFPDRPDLICYGSGTNSWGVQTNQKALAAYAVLAADPDLDESNAGMTRGELMARALGMLRFSLQSHLVGDYSCTDGTSWGHTWISALGIERMMHGVEAIRGYLSAEDLTLLKGVLVSECNWLMDHYFVEAGPVDHNKPESNLWNGAVLHRTATMYPDLPRSAEYREKGSRFLVNSNSIPADAASTDMVDGKRVSDWYVGNNYFSTFALNHHHYLNVGYMVICLSNVAMLHFMYREKCMEPCQALYQHAVELWQLVKTCIFPDGRLLRIGGDTRVRYCYCQDYLIPALLLVEDKYGDMDSQALEKGWLDLVRHEQQYNGDGSFLSQRGEKLAACAPLYYARLESDRAATLSMGLYWRRLLDSLEQRVLTNNHNQKFDSLTSWMDDFHGACLHRSDNRVASWVWEAGEKPTGLCLPTHRSDMAEWHMNLAGEIKGMGFFNKNRILYHHEHSFTGGFITYGRLVVRSENFVAEGEGDRDIACEKIVYAALPDDATVIILQQGKALNREYLRSVKGLFLQIPNDLFNGNRRNYYTQNGKMEIQGNGSCEEQRALDGSWVNIDNCLTLMKGYGTDPITLYRPGTRQIQIRDRYPDTGSLYADEICCCCRRDLHSVDKGSSLFDIGFILRTGESFSKARESYSVHQDMEVGFNGDKEVRGILCQGLNDKHYLVVGDMGLEEQQHPQDLLIKLPSVFKRIVNIASGKVYDYSSCSGGFHCQLEKDSASLFIVE